MGTAIVKLRMAAIHDCVNIHSIRGIREGGREGGGCRGGGGRAVSVQHLLRHASPLLYTVTEGARIVKCEP